MKLANDCTGHCSSLDDFFRQFGVAYQQKIRKSVFLRNPQSATLFGHQNVLPTPIEKEGFMVRSTDLEAYKDNGGPSNCWSVQSVTYK